MKVLYIITRSDRGGGQVALLDLLAHLPPDIDPVVAAGEEGFLSETCAQRGVPFRLVRGLVAPISPVRDCSALVRLISLIRSEKPRLIHAHTSKAGILGRMAAWLTRTPIIFTAHTWSFDEGVPSLRRKVAIPLERFAASIGGRIITVSDANTNKALRHAVASKQSMIRIWNGVPDSDLRAKPGTRDEVTMISVARMVPQKDFELLIRSLAGVEGNWRLQLVGDGPLRPSLESLGEQLGLTSRLQFLGERNDVAKLLSNADIFLLISKWEGLPISIIEAMRAGLPVIASDVGGVNEMVEPEINGLLTRMEDEEMLRGCIKRLIASPSTMAEFGIAGRRRFERDFRIETNVAKTMVVYEEVLGSTGMLTPLSDSRQAK
jgi:glycosyltransferase involved in cell wall biosynthesis